MRYPSFAISSFPVCGCMALGMLLLLLPAHGFPQRKHDATNTPRYYREADFYRVNKVDAHVHIRTADTAFIHQARLDHFRLMTIVVDEPPGMDTQQELAIHHHRLFPDIVSFATTFSVDGWGRAEWTKKTVAHLEASFRQGAAAVKIYKNIGMVLTDSLGRFVMIDNAGFDSVLNYLAVHRIPVIGHLGEPRDCWLPIDQMRMEANKKYYSRHPEFHMYRHPEYPSYARQIAARDSMLAKHPNLQFIGAHLGSLEWNTDTLAAHLDAFPNLQVDLAARMADLQFLAHEDWRKVHDFCIRYQDRLVYGTDRIADDAARPQEMARFAHEAWLRDWAFLTSGRTWHAASFPGGFRGLHLPKAVIDKIYRKNIERVFRSQFPWAGRK